MSQLITNWPNCITFLRILVVPLIVIFYYVPHWGHFGAAILFLLAAITDWLDGYLARYLKQTTRLGAFLDPVADKLLVCIVLVLIVDSHHVTFILPKYYLHLAPLIVTVPAIIILCRELIVAALREWMAELGNKTVLAVSYLGKLKTVMQMLALTILLLCDQHTNFYVIILGYVCLYIAVILTIWSMLCYVVKVFGIYKNIRST